MELNILQHDKTIIAEIHGRIDGMTAQEFQDRVIKATPDDGGAFVCDFSGVSYISSAGLRAVLIIAKRLARQGGLFSICGQRGPVAEVFRLSGFEKIVTMYATRENALTAIDT